jgi:FixJ family two-component response regulator
MIPNWIGLCHDFKLLNPHVRGNSAKGCLVAAIPLISIIDDDPSLQKALVRLVHSLGYEARGFASAEEFLESGAMWSCSCIVTDIQMPGMSGIDLKRLMDERECSVPVIMITARTERELEQGALASGALCFLRKPIDPDVLVDCFARVLKR